VSERSGATRHKLEEAAFFLGYLKPNYGKDKKFDFFLSAFLNAARAVTWIMGAEYGKVDGYKAWYDALRVDAKEEELLKGTGDARNRSLKSEPLRTLQEAVLEGVRLNVDDTSFIDDEAEKIMKRIALERLNVRIGGSSGKYTVTAVVDGKPVTLHVRRASFDRKLKEFPDQHILDVCTRYHHWLATLVSECEAKFGPSIRR
jgi:hypothetical protein